MHIRTRTRRIVSGAFIAILLAFAMGLLFRDALASLIAARVLAGRGFHCTEVAMHIPLSRTLPIHLGATRCSVAAGPLKTIEFKTPLEIHLDRFKLRLACDSLDIDLHPREHRDIEMNVLGDLARIAGADQPALELMSDAADLSRDDNPPLLAARAVVRLAGKPVTEFRELRVISTETGMVVSSPDCRVDQVALLGSAVLRLVATPTAAIVNVAFKSAHLDIKVELERLDSAKPRAAFTIGDAKVSAQ